MLDYDGQWPLEVSTFHGSFHNIQQSLFYLLKASLSEALNEVLRVLTHSSEFLICCRALAISAAIEPGGP